MISDEGFLAQTYFYITYYLNIQKAILYKPQNEPILGLGFTQLNAFSAEYNSKNNLVFFFQFFGKKWRFWPVTYTPYLCRAFMKSSEEDMNARTAATRQALHRKFKCR